MNILTKLKSLAKEADEIYPNYELSSNAKSRFYNAANPETVLKLIDAIEVMSGALTETNTKISRETLAEVRKLLESEPTREVE